MQNVDEIARQMATQGMIDPISSLRKKSKFEEMLMALAMSDKINPQTNLGFLLGQGLGGGLQSWAENYSDRGYIKNRILTADPAERMKLLEDLKRANPQQYERITRMLTDKGIDVSNAPQSPTANAGTPPPQQPDTAGINSDTTRALAQRAIEDGLLNKNGSALESAIDSQREMLPEVNSPFESADYSNPDNWNKWANLQEVLNQRRWNGYGLR